MLKPFKSNRLTMGLFLIMSLFMCFGCDGGSDSSDNETGNVVADTGSAKFSIQWHTEEVQTQQSTRRAVRAAKPNWVTLTDLKDDMVIYGLVYIDGAKAANGSFLGAFGPRGETDCRGTYEIFEEGNSNYSLVIGSDVGGELITFKIWDATTQEVYDISQHFTFTANATLPDTELYAIVSSTTTTLPTYPSEIDCLRAGVDSIKAVFKDVNENTIAIGGPWQCDTHTGEIIDIPAGSDYRIILSAYNSDGYERYQGQKSGITIVGGQTTDLGIIEVYPVWEEPTTTTTTTTTTIPMTTTTTTIPMTTTTTTTTPMTTTTTTTPIVETTTTTTLPFNAYTNSVGMTFKLISAGTFMMGSPDFELGRETDESPQHEVILTQSFYMQETEVTQGQWLDVMGGINPSYFPDCGLDCPVEKVSWEDVQLFVSKLNLLGEGTYRLPTEAEWEYAARAGSTTAFYNGEISETDYTPIDPILDIIGWYGGNSDVTYSGCFDLSSLGGSVCSGTHPVAQKLPNDWGLYDMSGNVFEWVEDWYDVYPTSAVTEDPTGPDTGSSRVVRGGGWENSARGCRSADRGGYLPGDRDFLLGFRLLRIPNP